MNKLLLLLTSTLCTITAHAQNTTYIATAVSSSATVNIDHVPHTAPPYVLTDKKTGVRFILHDDKHVISAVDKNSDTLWTTNPRKDNNVWEYRVKDPVINSISLHKGKWSDNKEVVWIVYVNSQFGYLDKQTGKFSFLGQD